VPGAKLPPNLKEYMRTVVAPEVRACAHTRLALGKPLWAL